MKLCTIILVKALDGKTVTEAEVLETSLVEDDYQPPPLGRPVQVGDRLHITAMVDIRPAPEPPPPWPLPADPGAPGKGPT